MQNLTKEWLRDQLTKRGRGSQKALADHLRLDPTMISKILNGTREVQAREIGPILDFFGTLDSDAAPQLQELRQLEEGLAPKQLQELLAFAQFLHQQQENEQTAKAGPVDDS